MSDRGWDKFHGWLRRRRDLSTTAKVIYTWLAPLVRKGKHPGMRLIASECGCSVNSVRRALRDLEEADLLRVQRSDSGRRSVYQLPEIEVVEEVKTVFETDTVDEAESVSETDTRTVSDSDTVATGVTVSDSDTEACPKRIQKRVRNGYTTRPQTPDQTHGTRARAGAHTHTRTRARGPRPTGPFPDPLQEQPRALSTLDFVLRIWVHIKRGEVPNYDPADIPPPDRRQLEELTEYYERRCMGHATPDAEFVRVVRESLRCFLELELPLRVGYWNARRDELFEAAS